MGMTGTQFSGTCSDHTMSVSFEAAQLARAFPMLSVSHVSPAGWAVAESSKKRGLLEDFRLQCEVGLSVTFETLRWLLRKGLLLPGTHRSSQHAAFHVPDAKVRWHHGIIVCVSNGMHLVSAWQARSARSAGLHLDG